ncbi:hypothetical protein IX293_001147 [Fusobacterium necrophorum]|nr:hypothetical protein [Fusobacterium necrophorum]MBR8822885.1 hypothetical protein [Fusobacterium necrophorum]
MIKSIAENIIQEIREQEAIVPAPTDGKDLFKPNKNHFVKYKMEQLKAYCLIKKKIKNLLEEIQEIERYGLNEKSKGIMLYQEHSNYIENLSEYEKKERVLHYLREEYKKLYPVYQAYAMGFLLYENYEPFEIWRLKEVEGMTEKAIKSLYKILGKDLKYTFSQAKSSLKEMIMLEDKEMWNYFGI